MDHIVFVYGTLRKGFGNNVLLDESDFLGDAITVGAYSMYEQGIPYVSPIGEQRIYGEVYSVGGDTLAQLDSLEGHPDWYNRRQIAVLLESGETIQAWLYFMPNADGNYVETGDYALPIAYFAYGSNMNPERMIQRCPGVWPLFPGTLENFRLEFDGRGHATIRPDEGGLAQGVVWRIDNFHEDALDGFEGLASGVYSKDLVTVIGPEYQSVRCLTYISTDPEIGVPTQEYLQHLIKGMEYFGITIASIE